VDGVGRPELKKAALQPQAPISACMSLQYSVTTLHVCICLSLQEGRLDGKYTGIIFLLR
jgi:hypothetical protein